MANSMYVRGAKLHVDDKPVPYRPSPNRSGSISPELIIIHDTASGLNDAGPISWLCNPQAKASAHFVVGRRGEITQLVPTNVKAWHAGKSSYRGRSNVNNFSIGIEIVNPGWLTSKDNGRTGTFSRGSPTWDAKKYGIYQVTDDAHPGRYYWMSYTQEQILAVIEICRALYAAYPRIDDIQPHWYISPGRKVDTNPLYPLDSLRKEVFNNRGPVRIDGAIEVVKEPSKGNEPDKSVQPAEGHEVDYVFEHDAETTANLNVRPWPSTSSPRFGTLRSGVHVDIDRRTRDLTTGDTWYFIRAKKADFAWLDKGSKQDSDGVYRGCVHGSFLTMLP